MIARIWRALHAKVFEHYSARAAYGQQARDLISQSLEDLAQNLSQATPSNFVDPRWLFVLP
jgi:hypothetical protein